MKLRYSERKLLAECLRGACPDPDAVIAIILRLGRERETTR